MSAKKVKQKIRIEHMPLDKFQRAPRNPKNHNLDQISQSISRFGYVAPILIDERTQKIVAGHGRLDTLQQLKASGGPPPDRIISKNNTWLIPVIRGISFDSDSEAEGYLLADNRLTELGGWDESGLAKVLSDLAAQGEGMLEGIGWDGNDLDKLLEEYGEEKKGLTDDDAVPDVPDEPISKLGDLYVLGDHRLLCADATKQEDVERLIKSKK